MAFPSFPLLPLQLSISMKVDRGRKKSPKLYKPNAIKLLTKLRLALSYLCKEKFEQSFKTVLIWCATTAEILQLNFNTHLTVQTIYNKR